MQAVSVITGLALSTLRRDLLDLGRSLPEGRVRRPGGGRKRLSATDPTLIGDFKRIVAPATRGGSDASKASL